MKTYGWLRDAFVERTRPMAEALHEQGYVDRVSMVDSSNGLIVERWTTPNGAGPSVLLVGAALNGSPGPGNLYIEACVEVGHDTNSMTATVAALVARLQVAQLGPTEPEVMGADAWDDDLSAVLVAARAAAAASYGSRNCFEALFTLRTALDNFEPDEWPDDGPGGDLLNGADHPYLRELATLRALALELCTAVALASDRCPGAVVGAANRLAGALGEEREPVPDRSAVLAPVFRRLYNGHPCREIEDPRNDVTFVLVELETGERIRATRKYLGVRGVTP